MQQTDPYPVQTSPAHLVTPPRMQVMGIASPAVDPLLVERISHWTSHHVEVKRGRTDFPPGAPSKPKRTRTQ